MEKNPATIIRLVGQTDVRGSKRSTILTEVRTVGVANVDCVIREEAHDGPQQPPTRKR